ncbi:MAG: primosomal protein N' [Faecalimonas sp.]|nr:primosomal protein N' [Faecalimonas sp.]
MYAKVIVDITHEKLDKVFEYGVPSELEGLLRVGMEVIVPFGKGNRETAGYVVELAETCTYDCDKVKEILRIAENRMAIEGKLVALAAWMKEHYGGTMIQSLKTVLPIKKEEKAKMKRYVRLLLDEQAGAEKLQEFLSKKNQRARARVLAALLDNSVLEYEFVIQKLQVTRSVLTAMEGLGILRVESEQVFRNPIGKREQLPQKLVYTEEQQNAIDIFRADYLQGLRKTYLLYGVTGSGKTEVYMEMIARVVRDGKQAIVLIPEIALTYQTVMRFYRRFGDRISILNSRMSNGERYDQMMRAKAGNIDVMIGPRSALFTPFPNLGLIVIDEEHEPTYKSEQIPRYHARETAIARAKLEGAAVVLGSATPSLESFYRSSAAYTGEDAYERLLLRHRSKMQKLPDVYVEDMREELRAGNRSILSERLHSFIEDRLEKGQQTMLFLNRRGYAGFLSCRACGFVVKCPHCDVSLTAHRGGKMVCHYCGYEEPEVKACPSCGSKHIGGFRAGTQQIEELVKKEFPSARVLRMDMDTTREKDGHEKILEQFANGEADILVGTQMIVKGHDFPNVSLVGILAADLSLYADDYRAGERTFQLLTQAAGRAGRGTAHGEVVIQTYSPEHYAIETAAMQDYEAFYEAEIAYREAVGYPPVEHLTAILLSGQDESLLDIASKYVKSYADRVNRREIQIIGPTTPSVGKVKDVYRRVIYMKHESYEALTEMKDQLERYMEINPGFQKLRVQFDFDPMGIS